MAPRPEATDMGFQQLGKYRILERIGRGAMGEVYRAHDPILDRYVAVKTMNVSVGGDEEMRERFEREAQSAARLNHPNIITVHDFGEEQGTAYMAMELLEGIDLKEVIKTKSLATLEAKLDLMEQVCEGLAYAHSRQVVHRDLKPANIHLLRDGQVKIMDFGLARLGAASGITKTGVVMGTPNYMSPEQARGERADARADIFALGVVFYELLSNHGAFEGDSLAAVLFQVMEQEPKPLDQRVRDIPPTLVRLVEKAMAKDPAQRFRDAGELREAVRAVRRALAGEISEAEALVVIERPEGFDTTLPRAPIDLASTYARSPGAETDGTAALDVSAAADTVGREPVVVPRPGPGSRPSLPRRATTATLPPPKAPVETPVPSQPAVAPAPALPRATLYVTGGLVLAALVLGVSFALLRSRDTASTGPAPAALNALTHQLVTTQIELARDKLEGKDYRGASAQAERALRLDPGSDEARAIRQRAQELLAEIEADAAEARSALAAGDNARASKALGKVLALDPKHPVAAELLGRLNGAFRGQAGEARAAMRRSQAEAEQARAGSLAAFREAASFGRQAEALYDKGEFAEATGKFLEARDGFERARLTARPKAPPARVEPNHVLTAPVAAGPSGPPRVTLAPANPTGAAPSLATTVPPPTLAATAAPAATVPPPPATQPVAPRVVEPVAPPSVAIKPVDDEASINKVIADYGRAIETKDLALFRSVKPNISAEEERRLRAAFEAVRSHKVVIDVRSVRVEGTRATVRLTRHDTLDGTPASPVQQTVALSKGPGGEWTIREIGQ